MAIYYILLSIHILGATIWAGGHLVLTVSVMPEALKKARFNSSRLWATKNTLLGLNFHSSILKFFYF